MLVTIAKVNISITLSNGLCLLFSRAENIDKNQIPFGCCLPVAYPMNSLAAAFRKILFLLDDS